MNQCVPSWDIQENPTSANKLSLRSNSNSTATDVPMLNYEVAELTWENGQLAMHGLGPSRVSSSKYTTWDKPRASGTLESIVNQATRLPDSHPFTNTDDLGPFLDPNQAAASDTRTMDAMVPCANQNACHTTGTATRALESIPGLGTCMVGSCSAAPTTQDGQKRARVARVPVAPEWSRDQSVGASASVGRDSLQMSLDTYDKDFGVGFTSTSLGSAENASSAGKRKITAAATTADDHDSVCHSRLQRETEDENKKKGTGKSSGSTKRSRAAAIHNQSERKRRDKINERMKTLQKLVPSSSKTDKASMLDEVIDYMKQLQAQVQMMQRMNMMLPMAMQQQLQMSMMAPMGMMGMGVMDMNSIARSNIPSMSPFLHPSAFMPMASCDGSSDRLPSNPMASVPDPLSNFLACQSQPMTMDAYRKMAAMYQQHLQPPSNSKS